MTLKVINMKIIAETAGHHEGDFNFMKTLVGHIAASSASVAKLHITLSLDEYMTADHPVYELIKNWQFDECQWTELISTLRSNEKELMLLANDTKAVEFAKRIEANYIEIHSVALNDLRLLAAAREVINEDTKLVLGVGGSTLEEIDHAISFVGSRNVVLMFGFQNYPTNYSDINFNKIRRIMALYPQFEFGYADHTSWDEVNNMLVTMMGAALGVTYVEKHVSHVPGEKRADAAAVVNFNYIDELAKNISILESCNGTGSLLLNSGEQKYSNFGIMKKAALLSRNLLAGEELTTDSIEFKRTSRDCPVSQIDAIYLVGKRAKYDLPCGLPLQRSDYE